MLRKRVSLSLHGALGGLALTDIHERHQHPVRPPHHRVPGEGEEHLEALAIQGLYGRLRLEEGAALGQRGHLLGEHLQRVRQEDALQRAEQLLLAGGAEHPQRGLVDAHHAHLPHRLAHEVRVGGAPGAYVLDALAPQLAQHLLYLGEVLLPDGDPHRLHDVPGVGLALLQLGQPAQQGRPLVSRNERPDAPRGSSWVPWALGFRLAPPHGLSEGGAC